MAEPGPAVLKAAPAFPRITVAAAPDGGAPGLLVRERRRAIAAVSAFTNGGDEVASRLRETLGLAPPDGSRRVAEGLTAILGTGPRSWLVTREGGAPLAAELATLLDGHAAVADQSDGYAVIRLAGPAVRSVLAKGIGIDLHDRAFPPGSVAQTACAHIGVILWRLDDEAGHAVFEVALYRSYAESFLRFLHGAAAEFGCAAEPSRPEAAS